MDAGTTDNAKDMVRGEYFPACIQSPYICFIFLAKWVTNTREDLLLFKKRLIEQWIDRELHPSHLTSMYILHYALSNKDLLDMVSAAGWCIKNMIRRTLKSAYSFYGAAPIIQTDLRELHLE